MAGTTAAAQVHSHAVYLGSVLCLFFVWSGENMRMKMLATEMKKQERTMHPCPACDENGVVDFIDLVRGRAELHCPRCPTTWAEQTEATMKFLGK